MKRFLSILLSLCLTLSCIPAVFAENPASISLNTFGEQTVPAENLSAFEGGYKGYTKSMDVFEGRSSQVLKRDGTDETEKSFCYYRWGTLVDQNNELIPLSSANYIVIDYYYHSPDANPALVGNTMRWTQVRICADSDVSAAISFGVSTTSRNGMVANKWDKLVLPLGEAAAEKKALYANEIHYLHQIKLYPLQNGVDMGKNDVLYISDITIQSWDPDSENSISERTVRFYGNEDDAGSPEKALASVNTKDLEYFTVPEFTGTAPENMEFFKWRNSFDGQSYEPGESIQMLAGQDISFVPVFNYTFNFSKYENAYINGYPDGTFLPQNNVTRAEACKIIASIVNPDGKDMGTTAFADVASDAWYYNAVTTLENLGALGIFSGNFEPNTKITRSELVEIVYAIADKNYDSVKLAYISDVTPNDRFYDAVMYAVSAGIITGYDDSTFKPANNITRAETVTIVNRLLGRTSNGSGDSKFSDIADHWAKGQIIASATAKAEGTWTVNTDTREYVLEGSSPEDYIKALHDQSKNLTGDAIRRGIDTISEQMKKDILNTHNTEYYYGEQMSGNTYYVSELNGNDENNGRTPETAFKTIAGLNKKFRFPKVGTAILFERGGTYRGQITLLPGCIYGAYGEGEKPIITASQRDYADPSLWIPTDKENVYELTEKLANVGLMVFDHKKDDHGNYDGLYGTPRIYGKNIGDYSGLSNDLEFFPTNDTVYLYCEGGNPGERFDSIEIGANVHIFKGSAKNVVIDNLSIRYTGGHGIGVTSGNNFIVTNSEFCWIGGSLMGTFGKSTSQYGNAVQIYGSCDGYYVKNNWMYQIYDTAVTHQGIDYTMNNIEYSGNLMEYVHWGIECWIRKQNKSTEMHNYIAKHNVMRNGGYGWGSIVSNRQGTARLYSFTTVDAENSNLRCEFNIIDRCAGYLIDVDKRSSETFDSNIYVQNESKRLGGLKGASANTTKFAAQGIIDNLKDTNLVFVYIPR